ncbi:MULTISPECIES: flagellar protein [unclassified Paenibacillus]|uniref:flagellar protein n=1 Tax=unclassified Paenibacillus TaxID=185978 RepID=UPI001AE5D51F|nr:MULTISPECIES: flagellar protein [unclassified Paenibacillus]MBP1157809.1 flagellar operon protein (TIGR03826 family) [Paenibacillus sp. PvP091]MBP1171455.1 flagellar operon protein (TIGR03826 family) [Paenibacillus sp. PvR098]MBP2442483.1 flagellar operon protein (TIGR03826 family) [Paenibacillus sp. PvP052]
MSLNVENCVRCGKVYLKNNFGMCTNCIKDIEAEYEKCLKFLRENRTCTIQELSDETGVDMKQIVKFIREGRISIRNNPNMGYECDMCGTIIRTNNICDNCRSRLAKDFDHLHEDEERKKSREEQQRGSAFKIREDRTKN